MPPRNYGTPLPNLNLGEAQAVAIRHFQLLVNFVADGPAERMMAREYLLRMCHDPHMQEPNAHFAYRLRAKLEAEPPATIEMAWGFLFAFLATRSSLYVELVDRYHQGPQPHISPEENIWRGMESWTQIAWGLASIADDMHKSFMGSRGRLSDVAICRAQQALNVLMCEHTLDQLGFAGRVQYRVCGTQLPFDLAPSQAASVG